MNAPAFAEIVFAPDVPPPLVLLLALVLGGLTVWAYLRTSERLSLARRLILLALRLAAVALVLFILLQPARLEKLPSSVRSKVALVALDESRSMRQRDAGKLTRFEAARELLWDAGLAPRNATAASTPTDARLFRFSENAALVTTALAELRPDGASTRFHPSIETVLGSLAADEGASALFLLTDGHDFELVNPARTAQAARNRRVPIYAVSFGGEGMVRDLSVRMTSYQPFHYAKQTIRLSATLRPLGCPYETVNVSLRREGKVVQTRAVVIRDEAQLPLVFEVNEPVAGQFEYEIRAEPLSGEVDAGNNVATTYVNVLDKKIRVLLLEGRPYWDTTFLLRSLRRNEKLDVDSVVAYAKKRLRVVRTEGDESSLKLPASAEDWNRYDLVILGQAVDTLLSPDQIAQLSAFVEEQGGVAIFARGDAFSGKAAGATLSPVAWGQATAKRAPLKINREGQNVTPLRLLAEAAAQPGGAPEMIGGYRAGERKTLSATLAETEDGTFPALVHRRQGAGQVLGVGVDGLWRWAFNARIDGPNTVFDRFWDQTVLWLVSSRDIAPSSRYTVRADTGNVLLGEKIRFRVILREPDRKLRALPLSIRHEVGETAKLDCAAAPGGAGQRFAAEFLPTKTGRYVTEARLPDNTTQTVRFHVYRDDAEDIDVAADPSYLRRLCEASGGRVLKPADFAPTLAALKSAPVDDTPRTRRVTLWDRAWVFWLIGATFGMDWYLRRRWGLC